jgi:BMFP domain-containing protein YqiC
MYPPMKMDEHREEREKLERRIAELERQLLEYARKKSGV